MTIQDSRLQSKRSQHHFETSLKLQRDFLDESD